MDLINISSLTDHLLRPPKFTYSLSDLGPSIFHYSNQIYERIDFTVFGRNNQIIQSSIWRIKNRQHFTLNSNTKDSPIILYLHCNCGSRVEAMQLLYSVLELGYTFVAYDSQGCGHSQGQYISLGYHEAWDLQAIICHIDLHFSPNPQVVLWGRSMGAVTSINFLAHHQAYSHNIKVAVLDSPFINLRELICQIINQKVGAPKILADVLVSYIQPIVHKKVGFKISQFDLRKQILDIKCPIILMASKSDGLVPFKHLEEIYDRHQGKKSIFYLNQSHTDQRSSDTLGKIFKAISRYFEQQSKAKLVQISSHSVLDPKKLRELSLFTYRSSEYIDQKTTKQLKQRNRKKLQLYSAGRVETNYTDFSNQKPKNSEQPKTEMKKKLSLNHSKSNSRAPATLSNIRTTIHLYSKDPQKQSNEFRYTPASLMHKLSGGEPVRKKIVSNFSECLAGQTKQIKACYKLSQHGEAGKQNLCVDKIAK